MLCKLNGCAPYVVLVSLIMGFTNECPGEKVVQDSFDDMVRPFLAEYCLSCHSGDEPEARFDLKVLSANFSSDETANRWVDVMHSLRFGEMPPPEEKQPTSIEKVNVVDWVFQKMIEANRFDAYQKKLMAPEHGNWVSHEKLFSGQIKTPPFSPSRLWRFSPEIFANKGFGKAKSPYTYVTSERGIRDYAALSVTDQSTVQMMMIVADSSISDRERRGEFKQFANQPAPNDSALQAVIAREFQHVIERAPTKSEMDKYLAFLKQSIEVGGNLDGLKTTIKAIFLCPESIYRMEFGLGEVDEHGRRHLSSEELGHAIAFALTDRGPNHNRFIRNALQKGQLETKEQVAWLVQKMLDEQLTTGRWDRKDLPRVMRFFDEFFGFHRAGTVFKDNDRRRAEKIPQWNTGMLIHDARMLIEHVLREDKNVIAELLTTNRYFIAHPGDNAYAREHYKDRVAEVIDPGYVDSQVEKRRGQVEKDFNFRDMPEKAERALEAARKDAEKTVKKFRKALDQGMFPHPGFPIYVEVTWHRRFDLHRALQSSEQ